MGHRVIGFELQDSYCEIIRTRLAPFNQKGKALPAHAVFAKPEPPQQEAEEPANKKRKV